MRPQIPGIVIVEGKYDKIKLESLFDGCFVATNGFEIFKDKALLANLRKMTAGQTVVIMTDSDRAGFRIRKYLHDTLKEADLFDVYIPDIFGREKRKEKPSAEGKLGVEGMPPDVLRRLAQTIAAAPTANGEVVTLSDLYYAGLYGRPNSATLRRAFQNYLGYPARMNKNMFLKVLNMTFTKQQFEDHFRDFAAENDF